MTDNRKRLTLRVPPELYERIEEARWVARTGQNDFLIRLIEHALNAPRPARQKKKVADPLDSSDVIPVSWK